MIIRPNRDCDRPGVVAVWIVLSLSVIVGIVAINLDGGRALEERRCAQAAADAAALAAGADLYSHYWTNHGLDPYGTAQTAAQNAAIANGLPASAVTVNIPPISGTFAGKAGYVEVLVQTELDATFGKIFTSQALPVTARSVASGHPREIGFIALAPSGAATLLNKSVALTLINTPIIVNSSDAAAFTQQSFGVVLANRFDVTGNYINPGGAIMLGQVNTNVSPTPDPFTYLPVPNSASYPVQSAAPLTVNALFATLQPGVYRGGVHITGLTIVNMMPGVYIMEGGGFVVDGVNVVTAMGVMIYNTTSGAYPTPGPISVNSTGAVLMTAPSSGIYQGINFFQNRLQTTPISISGLVALTDISGIVYGFSAPASLSNGLVVANILGGGWVANTITVSGVASINIDLKQNPPRIPDVKLVE